jgi:hypothetical protein
MLTCEYKKPLTGEMLLDIVSCHLTCFGNNQLITKPEIEDRIEISIDGEDILACMDHDSMAEDNHKLNFLAARLKNLPEGVIKQPLQTTSKIDTAFQVGFYVEQEGWFYVEQEGFIEVINCDEIQIKQS